LFFRLREFVVLAIPELDVALGPCDTVLSQSPGGAPGGLFVVVFRLVEDLAVVGVEPPVLDQHEHPVAVGDDLEEPVGIGLAHVPGDGLAALVQTEFLADLVGPLVEPAQKTQCPAVDCLGHVQGLPSSRFAPRISWPRDRG
jgi:hypothetical protein